MTLMLSLQNRLASINDGFPSQFFNTLVPSILAHQLAAPAPAHPARNARIQPTAHASSPQRAHPARSAPSLQLWLAAMRQLQVSFTPGPHLSSSQIDVHNYNKTS